jgi:hypothetical protein
MVPHKMKVPASTISSRLIDSRETLSNEATLARIYPHKTVILEIFWFLLPMGKFYGSRRRGNLFLYPV